jgi:hypothetical protein
MLELIAIILTPSQPSTYFLLMLQFEDMIIFGLVIIPISPDPSQLNGLLNASSNSS